MFTVGTQLLNPMTIAPTLLHYGFPHGIKLLFWCIFLLHYMNSPWCSHVHVAHTRYSEINMLCIWLLILRYFHLHQKKLIDHLFRVTLTKIYCIKININLETGLQAILLLIIKVHLKITGCLCQKGEKCNEIARGNFSKNTEIARLAGSMYAAEKSQSSYMYMFRIHHWNWMNNYWIFWIGCLLWRCSMTSFCEFWKMTSQ